jgi:hypothetical protein
VIVYSETRELVLAFVEKGTRVVHLATPEMLAECGFVPKPAPAPPPRVYVAPESLPKGVYRIRTLGADRHPEHSLGEIVTHANVEIANDDNGQKAYLVSGGTYVHELEAVG